LNALGVETTSSCCGHDRDEFMVWFNTEQTRTRGMALLARAVCPRYGNAEWRVELYHGDHELVTFQLTGPKRASAGDELAKRITDNMAHKAFMRLVKKWTRKEK